MESILNESVVVQSTCLVCGKNVDSGWFAHIEEEKRWIFLCSPGCALKHFQQMHDFSAYQTYFIGTEPASAVPDWSDLNKYL